MNIKDHWDSFQEHAITKQAGPDQIRDLKRAFYSGAFVIFGSFAEISASSVEDKEALELIDDLYQELEEFGKEIQS
jgi:hypothetical protein